MVLPAQILKRKTNPKYLSFFFEITKKDRYLSFIGWFLAIIMSFTTCRFRFYSKLQHLPFQRRQLHSVAPSSPDATNQTMTGLVYHPAYRSGIHLPARAAPLSGRNLYHSSRKRKSILYNSLLTKLNQSCDTFFYSPCSC